MTLSLSEIADALRWLWLAIGLIWLSYAWLHRIEYRRVVLGLLALVALDWGLHAFADFAERPGSAIPSDFALYSVMMLVAAGAGISASCLYARWRGMNVWTVVEAALVCVIVGGIGGRIYQVFTHWDFYSENTDLIAELSHGGFGLRGAIIPAFITLCLFALLTKNSFWKLADAAVVGLALAQSIGWYGAHITHMHYGISLDAPPPAGIFAPLAQFVRDFGYNFIQDLPDSYNLIAFRIPVQLLAAFYFLGLFILLLLNARSAPAHDGLRFTYYLVLAALGGFLLGFWRGDETLIWNGLRLDQWIDLALFVLGLALLWLHRERATFFQRSPLQHA
jgi:prolipoprotein diacylglyceryltransferase